MLTTKNYTFQKSFHGEAGNIISEMGVRSSLGGAKGQMNTNQSNRCALLRQPQQTNRKMSERQRNKALSKVLPFKVFCKSSHHYVVMSMNVCSVSFMQYRFTGAVL